MSDKYLTDSTHVRVIWRDGRSSVMTWAEYESDEFQPGAFYDWEIEMLNPDLSVWAPDTKSRSPGCQCHWEEGDSSCRVHGLTESHEVQE